MKFIPTTLDGALIIEPELVLDERGFFARTFCENEFDKMGLNPKLVQCNISFNKTCGTLRGMHYQKEPNAEAKLVRCTQGAIYDVIIDLRKDSETFKQWFGVELTAENRKEIYIPVGFAHGFLTLKDKSEVFYQMSQVFKPEFSEGVKWNDTAFNIKWPIEIKVISEKDKLYKNYLFS